MKILLQIELNPGATLALVKNVAQLSGGGMHVTIPAVRLATPFFNRQCFIQYISPAGVDEPPHLWQVLWCEPIHLAVNRLKMPKDGKIS